MKDLYKTVDKARDNLQQQEALAHKSRSHGTLLPQWVLLALSGLLLAVLLYMNLGRSIEQQVQEDLLSAAVSVLQAADSDVVQRYAETLQLPAGLSDPLVDLQVDYRPVGPTSYTLQVVYGPHQQLIARDVLEPLERSDILEAFGE